MPSGLIKDEWQSDDGAVRLILGDCEEILPMFEPGSVDAVVTDPPYGIGDRLTSGGGCDAKYKGLIGSGAELWDVVPGREILAKILSLSNSVFIWGGCFMELPPTQKPLCWDKMRPNQKNSSEWEFCWTSFVGRAEMFRYCGNTGWILKEKRVHPTQKPVVLMEWCLGFIPDAKIIFDPYMGSATTGVACVRTGRKFVGIEKEREYFDSAVDRCKRSIREDRSSFQIRPKPRPAPPGFFKIERK